MTLFLTSSCCLRETVGLDPTGGFIEELKKRLPARCRFLFICSDPDDADITDLYAASTADCFRREGFFFPSFKVLDGRNAAQAAELIRGADLIVLSGGHVPTQNRFFTAIGLGAMLKDFPGVIVGISAGTMNCAETVYAMPELEGEAVDPAYARFIPGLGLTDVNVIPHYDDLAGTEVDGLDVFRDIAEPDSIGRRFLVLPDGSYLLQENGSQSVRGRAYLIENGAFSPLQER